MNRLVIIGAGGHGKVIADLAQKIGYEDICFVDDFVTGDVIGIPIVGTSDDIMRLNNDNTDFVVGIGSNIKRKIIAETYQVNWVSLIHPSAQIACHVQIGKGTIVMANAVINVCAQIGNHCIINSGAIVEHDNVIENYAHISPNVALGGSVRIGSLTHVGIGATVKNNTEVCSGCIIGAGAVVVKHIQGPGVYVGVPVNRKLV